MASKRPIVVGGNTPGKPASKRSSTEGTSRKSLFQEGNEPKSHPGNESGMMQKRVPWFSTFACFGIMPSAINGQCRGILSFGMLVLVQSTRPVVLQGQVGKIQNVCFYWQRVGELSEIIKFTE